MGKLVLRYARQILVELWGHDLYNSSLTASKLTLMTSRANGTNQRIPGEGTRTLQMIS